MIFETFCVHDQHKEEHNEKKRLSLQLYFLLKKKKKNPQTELEEKILKKNIYIGHAFLNLTETNKFFSTFSLTGVLKCTSLSFNSSAD